jgi:hypothetical protein
MNDIFDIFGMEENQIRVVFTALDGVSEIRFIKKNLESNEFLTWNNFSQKSVFVKKLNGVLYHKEVKIL